MATMVRLATLQNRVLPLHPNSLSPTPWRPRKLRCPRYHACIAEHTLRCLWHGRCFPRLRLDLCRGVEVGQLPAGWLIFEFLATLEVRHPATPIPPPPCLPHPPLPPQLAVPNSVDEPHAHLAELSRCGSCSFTGRGKGVGVCVADGCVATPFWQFSWFDSTCPRPPPLSRPFAHVKPMCRHVWSTTLMPLGASVGMSASPFRVESLQPPPSHCKPSRRVGITTRPSPLPSGPPSRHHLRSLVDVVVDASQQARPRPGPCA